MKLPLIKLIVTILLSNTFLIQAQSMGANHRKYWWYKSRLNNDFMKVGLNAGESQPFNQRGVGGSGFNSTDGNEKMMIGDGKSTLGLYIAQLATEFALFKKNGQSMAKVKHELFCVLHAIDRLDYFAEGRWSSGSDQINGFL